MSCGSKVNKSCLIKKGKNVCVDKIKTCVCRDFFVDDNGIEFNSNNDPSQACFILGTDFANYNICQIDLETIQQATTTNLVYQNVKTDADGAFCVDMPQQTQELNITLKLKFKNNSKLCAVNSCAYREACCGHLLIKEDQNCIVFTQNFTPYLYDLIWRSYDGSANNLSNPNLGMRNQPLLRIASADYADGVSTLAERCASNPNPRTVSNNICKSTSSILNSMNLTDMTWAWGQFLDHELDLTPEGTEDMSLVTPSVMDDPEEEYPGRTITIRRSVFIAGSSPREQPNHISAFIDASNVYGYNSIRAHELRLLDGSGKMKTVTADNGEDILPYNTAGLDNAMHGSSTASDFFLAGDIRANENVVLIGMHTLFVREHNRLCDQIAIDFPVWAGQDELIYQHARRIVGGIMQTITMREFLPALLGSNAPEPYTFYNKDVDPSIATEFSTAGYRIGHTMLSSNLKVGTSGTLALRDAFFRPSYVQTNGIDALLQGAFLQVMQEIDGQIVDDVRNFLFDSPTVSHLLDLATLNIQRGRDHGLPDYNSVRVAYGLTAKASFAEITSNTTVQTQLANLYDSVDCIDPWIGVIIEDHLPGAAVGELLCTILKDQFTRLRDGDRFWFENDRALDDATKQMIRDTTLADVIIRNTSLTSADVPADVFHLTPP